MPVLVHYSTDIGWFNASHPPPPLVLCCVAQCICLFTSITVRQGGGALWACPYKPGLPSLDPRPGLVHVHRSSSWWPASPWCLSSRRTFPTILAWHTGPLVCGQWHFLVPPQLGVGKCNTGSWDAPALAPNCCQISQPA